MVRLLVTDQAREGAGDSVGLGLVEPIGGEHGIEHAHAGDQAELNGDDEHDPGNTGVNEGQPDRPARAQCAGSEHDLVLPKPCDQRARQSRADEADDDTEALQNARPYCQGLKPRRPSMRTATRGKVAMIRPLTSTVLKNSGRNVG